MSYPNQSYTCVICLHVFCLSYCVWFCKYCCWKWSYLCCIKILYIMLLWTAGIVYIFRSCFFPPLCFYRVFFILSFLSVVFFVVCLYKAYFWETLYGGRYVTDAWLTFFCLNSFITIWISLYFLLIIVAMRRYRNLLFKVRTAAVSSVPTHPLVVDNCVNRGNEVIIFLSQLISFFKAILFPLRRLSFCYNLSVNLCRYF